MFRVSALRHRLFAQLPSVATRQKTDANTPFRKPCFRPSYISDTDSGYPRKSTPYGLDRMECGLDSEFHRKVNPSQENESKWTSEVETFLKQLEENPGDLSAVSSFVKEHEDKTFQITANPTTLTVRICDLSGTDYMGQTFMLDSWQSMYLPEETKMEVLAAVDNYFGLQLIILVAEDGRVFAYEEERMFLLGSSLPELIKNGTNENPEIYRLQKSKAGDESNDEEIQRLRQETKDFVNSL